MHDEEALIRQAQACDPVALSTIYERYYTSVYNYIYYRVGQTPLAEDLTADVFVKMLEALPRYTPRGKPFIAWLYRIAHNRVVDHLRQQPRQSEVSMEDAGGELPPETIDPAAVAEDRLEQESLRQAINQLTEDQRQVILLRFIADLDNATIAAAMHKTEGSIKALQRRGLLSLRRLWKSSSGLSPKL